MPKEQRFKWVIMYKMIERMTMNGDFSDENGVMELIEELYSIEFDLAAQSAADYESQKIQIRDEVVADGQQQVTRRLIKDVQYTSLDAFGRLENSPT